MFLKILWTPGGISGIHHSNRGWETLSLNADDHSSLKIPVVTNPCVMTVRHRGKDILVSQFLLLISEE